MKLRLLVTAVLAVSTLSLPGAARADTVTVTARCTAAGTTTSCSTGWYTTDVTVSFVLPAGSTDPQGCGNQAVTVDTTGTTFTCTVLIAGTTQRVGSDVTIKRDASPPTASAISAARGADVNGWYNHAVTVSVGGTDATSGIASCTSVSYAGPDSSSASVSGSCRDNAGNVSATQTLSFKYDATAPSVSPAPSRGDDGNGWYNHAVDVAFKGSDATSGVASCSSSSYSGPDSASASVTGTCTDGAGNTGSATFELKYDATPPTVSGASADRTPDVNGWYNHPVVVTFAGTDATSGIASCDSVTYAKPDDPSVDISGRCRDNAGNVSAPGSVALKYDSTPPKLTELTAAIADRSVQLKWKDSKDVAQLTLQRSAARASAATVYNGRAIDTFADKRLRNGVRYTYTVVATDVAGNQVTAKVTAAPAPSLIAPRQEAHVRGGVTLRWRAVPKATYYNVQLWLKGVKVLTTWPTGSALRLAQLPRGRYVWHVWPGFGARAKHRFGPLVGTSSFVVTG